MTTLPVLTVNQVGEFIRHQSCPRRFRLEVNNRREARRLPFYNRLFNPLDPVLQAEGARREEQWAEMLQGDGLQLLAEPEGEEHDVSWERFVAAAAATPHNQPAFAREVSISGTFGAFPLQGRMDFVLLLWKHNRPHLRIVECKASRRDKTYQRLQVALYSALVSQSLSETAVAVAERALDSTAISAVVARIDQEDNSLQSILDIPPLDLTTETEDLQSLLAASGPLARYAVADLDSLPYQLNSKCDTCIFNTDCLPESGLHRRPQLLGLPPTSIRALRDANITTLDQLADLDPAGPTAGVIRQNPAFGESIDSTITKAKARRVNLPGGDPGYQVEPVPNTGFGGLPVHAKDDAKLVRVYLCVDYDYAENRVGAISAHVTQSESPCHTGFVQGEDGSWTPYARVVETPAGWTHDDGPPLQELPDLSGHTLVHFKNSPWTGNYLADTRIEGEQIERFLNELVDAIDRVSDAGEAPVHFYVWSRSELTRLVEACSRTSTKLLGHLRELLGCRESLEQLIFSSLQDEVSRRYGLGWTGRGLSVLASLRWFGKSYHWSRQVGREHFELDREFEQDIFDFKTTLHVSPDGQWARRPDEPNANRELFEIRSRFYDQLPAPYWRATWGELDPGSARDAATRNAIERYNRVRRPNVLRAYLEARTIALRWLEERVVLKNREISKPLLRIADLRNFELGTRDLGDACVDFLRLDQHVKASDWAARHLAPPQLRVSAFISLPLTNITASGNRSFTAQIDPESYGTSLAALAENCRFHSSGFARLTPRPDAVEDAQSLGLLHKHGVTCVLDDVDWDNGTVHLSPIPGPRPDQFCLSSIQLDPENPIWANATLDESPSGYVERRVHRRLDARLGTHVYSWFDPTTPTIPEQPAMDAQQRAIIDQVLAALGPDDRTMIDASQVAAIGNMFGSRVSLLQGPPGTGKTRTLAVALLLDALVCQDAGRTILITGTTHTSVDTLMKRVCEFHELVTQLVGEAGVAPPRLTMFRVDPKESVPIGVHEWRGRQLPTTPIVDANRTGVCLIFGVTSGQLRGADALIGASRFATPASTVADAVYVDEASMMKLPDFLALASLGKSTSRLLLAGDHRQLSPIVSHNWEAEDRPPAVLYKPFVSAYDAAYSLALSDQTGPASIGYSSLSYSHRLPPDVRDLIARVYRQDNIELGGRERPAAHVVDGANPLAQIWAADHGVYLVLHDEQESRRSNRFECDLIHAILDAADEIPNNSVAVMTPHRAQRTLLTRRLSDFDSSIAMIDTVERLQGGEKPTVIVSATASDPTAISSSAEFLLDLNRANVAFSRAEDRLIVVCSRCILEHVPDDVDQYASAMLWKAIRSACNRSLGEYRLGDLSATILCPDVVVD